MRATGENNKHNGALGVDMVRTPFLTLDHKHHKNAFCVVALEAERGYWSECGFRPEKTCLWAQQCSMSD